MRELREQYLEIQALLTGGDYETAYPLIYNILDDDPNDAAALNFLGYLWLQTGKEAWGYQMFRRALQEEPGNKAIWANLGKAAHELGLFDESIKCCLKAAELDNGYAIAYSNASATYVQTSDWAKAEQVAQLALELNPDDIHAKNNLAHSLLAQQRWQEGWEMWGHTLGGKYRKEYSYGDEMRWGGEREKNIVIYGEQGLGDEIFYASCIPDALSISAHVIIDCDKRLEGLFQRSFPQAEVHGTRHEDVADWVDDAQVDFRCAIGGLPELFRNQTEDFPGTPYLVADPERRTMWRALYKSWGKKVIGIATSGGTKFNNSKGRRISIEELRPLLKKNYAFVSLDYKPADTDALERELGVRIHKFPFAAQSQDYDDTAAMIAEMDMVVGVNTTALHCAAALGVKTWCLVPKFHQWRYSQASMPWYRSMKLIKQGDRDWAKVIKDVAREL